MLTERQDVFALGMIIHEVIFKCKPFIFSPKKCKEVYLNRNISDRFFVVREKLDDYEIYHIISVILNNVDKFLNVDP